MTQVRGAVAIVLAGLALVPSTLAAAPRGGSDTGQDTVSDPRIAYEQPQGGGTSPVGLVSWQATAFSLVFTAHNPVALTSIRASLTYVNCRRAIAAEVFSTAGSGPSAQPDALLGRSLNAPDNVDSGNGFFGYEPITWLFDGSIQLHANTRYAIRFSTLFDEANCHLRFEGAGDVDSSRLWQSNGADWFVLNDMDLKLAVLGTPFCTPAAILTGPTSQTVAFGESATLQVVSSGTGPFSYQWYQGDKGDTSQPAANGVLPLFATGPLTVSKRYWVRVTNPCGSADSDAAVVSPGPSVGTLHGTVGITDIARWPVDGPGSTIKVWVIELATSQFRSATVTGSHYTAPRLPPGNYVALAQVSYTDVVSVDNRNACGLFQYGCAPKMFTKTTSAFSAISTVSGNADAVADVTLPAVAVFLHGINSCSDKWYTSADETGWDNVARRGGVVSFTPNYQMFTDGNWSLAVFDTTEQIEANLRRLTSGVGTWGWPPWVIIGHSQGGLVARALINRLGSADSRVQALRRLYMLGTPNSGAAEGFAPLACVPYLAPSSMMASFNALYPSFGPLTASDVFAFAGVLRTRSGVLLPTDGVVTTPSVFGIWRWDCATCTPTLLHVVAKGGVGIYPHWDLGSPSSIAILTDAILPDVRLVR